MSRPLPWPRLPRSSGSAGRRPKHSSTRRSRRRWRATPSPPCWRSGCRARRARRSRSGSTTASCEAARACEQRLRALGYERQAMRAYRPGCRSSRIPAGSFRGSRLRRRQGARAESAVAVPEVAIKVESVAAFSRALRPGPGDRRLSDGPLPDRPDRRRADDAGRGRAARLPGLRAISRRPGARGPDEAARGPRCPGGARPLAGAEAPVRRRCRGIRRHRGDPRAGDRAGGLDRPGVPPGLRGRARVLAVAQHGRARSEGPAGPPRPGLGEPRPSHVPLLAAVLPANHRHVHAAGFRAARAVPRRGPRRLGRADPRAAGHGDRHLRRPRPAPEEATEDFAHQSLPDLPRPGTVGLWVACTASRSSRPACITSRRSSTSMPCATASRPRPASRRCRRSRISRS